MSASWTVKVAATVVVLFAFDTAPFLTGRWWAQAGSLIAFAVVVESFGRADERRRMAGRTP